MVSQYCVILGGSDRATRSIWNSLEIFRKYNNRWYHSRATENNAVFVKSYQGRADWNNADISICFCSRNDDNHHVIVLRSEIEIGFLFNSTFGNVNSWGRWTRYSYY